MLRAGSHVRRSWFRARRGERAAVSALAPRAAPAAGGWRPPSDWAVGRGPLHLRRSQDEDKFGRGYIGNLSETWLLWN
eukprot:1167772-Pyramimonas_sp.AAC.1